MALIKCKNCGKEISDKAHACPGCGYKTEEDVINSDVQQKIKGKSSNKKVISIVIGAIVVVLIAIVLFITLGNQDEKNPVDQTEQNNVVVDSEENNKENNVENIEISWEDNDPPTEVGGGESVAKILDTKIANSKYGTLLVMSFEYTNNSNDAIDFVNDVNCRVQPFQNGVALESPGVTSEEGVFDGGEVYKAVKNGGVIKAELAWILKDTVSPIEIEFGEDEHYKPDFIKIINLSGGSSSEDKSEKSDNTKSDYKIKWNSKAPEKIGNENEQAIIKNVAVVDSGNYGTVLVMDIDFINNLDDSRNLINDMACTIVPYQNGVALETPGTTSDGEYFNYSDAFTSVKKGGKVSTQLVWVLEDDSSVEVEFGLDGNYKVQYLSSFTFK